MSRKKENGLRAAVSVLCILLFGVKLTGGAWHAVFGTALAIICVGHICVHYVKMKRSEKKIRVVNKLQFFSLSVLFLSGVLMHPLGEALAVKMIHKLSAVIFILAMLGHVRMHKAKRGGGTGGTYVS